MKLIQPVQIFCFLTGAIFASVSLASAYYDNYLPGPILARHKMRRQKIFKLDFDHDWKAEIADINLENKEGKFSVWGMDKIGKPWTFTESDDRGFGGSCYSADLDGNGVGDIILHFPNGSCGYPFSSLVIFFIDKNGGAHREEVVSRFNAEKNGIADILDTPGGATVLVQDLAYGRIGKRDMGYWRWTALRSHDCKLVNEAHLDGVKLPAFVFFTKKENHKLSTRAAILEKEFRGAHKPD